MSVTELRNAPGTGEIYRRAVRGLVPGLGGRRRAALPERELVLRGVAVDRAHLARYDRVCGFRLTDALPATYPHVLAFPLAMRLMSEPGFPFPVVGLVHVGNRIEQLRPIDAAERLDLSVRAVDLRPHHRGRQFDLLATATVDGEPVWRGVSTYLRIDPAAATRAKRVARPDGASDDRPPRAGSAVWRVPTTVGTDYAGVSGDHNPIHTSRLGARLFGFPRPIAHGMWSKARCLAALEGRLPAAYTVDVAFKLPVLLPATVAFSATPSWDFALHGARSGKRHLTGTVRAG
ncbi:MAG TPA: MaoC/PaaZ C-terminal domain-containing protein [Catenuloplanes sp.]|jgi:acyl dehydratase